MCTYLFKNINIIFFTLFKNAKILFQINCEMCLSYLMILNSDRSKTFSSMSVLKLIKQS